MDNPLAWDEENSGNRGRIGPLGDDGVLDEAVEGEDVEARRRSNDAQHRDGAAGGAPVDGVGGGVGSGADAGMGGGDGGRSGSGADAGMGGAPTG